MSKGTRANGRLAAVLAASTLALGPLTLMSACGDDGNEVGEAMEEMRDEAEDAAEEAEDEVDDRM